MAAQQSQIMHVSPAWQSKVASKVSFLIGRHFLTLPAYNQLGSGLRTLCERGMHCTKPQISAHGDIPYLAYQKTESTARRLGLMQGYRGGWRIPCSSSAQRQPRRVDSWPRSFPYPFRFFCPSCGEALCIILAGLRDLSAHEILVLKAATSVVGYLCCIQHHRLQDDHVMNKSRHCFASLAVLNSSGDLLHGQLVTSPLLGNVGID